MQDNDTIAALATKAGNSAINIIKLSGTEALKITDRIFKAKNKKRLENLKSYSILYGNIYDERAEIIDEVIVSVMKGPASYTREDVVEINCHGGIAAVNRILDIVIKNGARLAEPGEFTKRAFLNGRIDLSQAEAVIDIINAKSTASLKIAASNLMGKTKDSIKQIRRDIIDIIAELEAKIDFIEEDLETIPVDKILKQLEKIINKITELIENEKKAEIVKEGIKIAIVGKPNVGKSSLLNLLVGKDKSIVTHIPGTTRDVIEDIINLDGIPVVFKDTAGIRETNDYIEQIGVKKSKEEIENSDITMVIIDNSRKITNEDLDLIKLTEKTKRIILLNKIDLKNTADTGIIKKITGQEIMRISAKKGTGIEEIIKKIKEAATGGEEFLFEEKVIVNKRQRILLEDSLENIKNAVTTIKMNYSEEFIITDLIAANAKIAELIGEETGDEVLNKIFSKFCIGK